MNLESLQELWKKDSVIDTDLYCEESTKIPQLHMRYMEFFNTYALMKKEREIKRRLTNIASLQLDTVQYEQKGRYRRKK